ncbi:MAG: hypothetical protein RIE31_05105 [Alphaproteobacteria bacterium]
MTTTKSDQMTQVDASPPTVLSTTDWHGRLRLGYFSYTQGANGSIGDDVELLRLPPGRCRVLGHLCRVTASDKAAGATLALGWATHTTAGTSVAADPDGLAAASDIASGPTTITPLAAPYRQFDSDGGVTLTATFGVVAPLAGDTVEGHVVYVQD